MDMSNESPDGKQLELRGTMNEDGAVECVFSSMEQTKVGTGTTSRTKITKLYWYVEEVRYREYSLRQLNSNCVPSGSRQLLSLEELAARYVPEIEFWEEKAMPAMAELEGHLENGEDDREDGKLYSAQTHFNNALGIEEKNVRALFNLGLVYIELKEHEKARDMMNELLRLKMTFERGNQHLFNELGIRLRKSGMFDDAKAYYSRALEFVEDDENLYYNLARVHYEKDEWAECAQALQKCSALNPQLEPAMALAEFIKKLARDRKLCKRYGKQPVPYEVAANLANLLQFEKASNAVVSSGMDRAQDRRATTSTEEKPSGDPINLLMD